MTKAQLSQADHIYIHTIEMLRQQVAGYERMMENCVVMPKDHYEQLLDMVKECEK